MLDTVRSAVSAPWKDGVVTPPGWEVQERQPARYDKGGLVRWAVDQRLVREGDDKTGSGFRIGGSGLMAEWCEVSLPRLLFGHNGRVIEDQGQIDQALAMVGERLRYWVNWDRRNFEGWRFTRVDLVQQFRGSPAAWCAAFVESGHPRVRRKAREFFGSGLTWDGSECVIRLYDKILEALGQQDGDVVRFEVELKGAALRKCLATEWDQYSDRRFVTRLEFARCYSEYRKILMGFQPRALARVPSGFNRLVAFCHYHKFAPGGVPILTLIRDQVSRRSWYRIKAAIREFRPEFTRIDLASLLPASGPMPVHVTDIAAANGSPVAAALFVA